MRTSLRFFFALALPLSMLAACGTDRESASPVDTGLDLSGVASLCPANIISSVGNPDINEIFPTANSLRNVARVNCGQVLDAFGKGKLTEAVTKAFAFFLKSLQQNEAGVLLVSGPSGEEDIVELFILILMGIGVDLSDVPPGDLADAVLGGEVGSGELVRGGSFILPSGHAGLGDPDSALSGPVTAIIVMIPPDEGGVELSSLSHPCPAGVDNTFDCYPLFFDYSVIPESNVDPDIGLQLGQCNVSPEGVEVELLSPEGFLPLDAAPTGVVCDDVQPEEITMTGWRSYTWAVIEPISPLLRVAPLFAGQNPVGGRISNFSPVAPADPESGEPAPIETQTELTPEEGGGFTGDVELFEAAVTDVENETGVNEGTVRFTVSGFDPVDVDVVEGSASIDVGCNTVESADITVGDGEYSVSAEYLGTPTYAPSSEPFPSSFSCTGID